MKGIRIDGALPRRAILIGCVVCFVIFDGAWLTFERGSLGYWIGQVGAFVFMVATISLIMKWVDGTRS